MRSCLDERSHDASFDGVNIWMANANSGNVTRHSDIRTTMNIYGDVVTNEMGLEHSKVVGLGIEPTRLTDCTGHCSASKAIERMAPQLGLEQSQPLVSL